MRTAPILIVFAILACDRPEAPPPEAGTSLGIADMPLELRDGAELFGLHCSSCHGVEGVGTEQGPPLVHRIYEPSHHGDGAFVMAALRGVRAHHWTFGDMPPVEGITQERVLAITAYVRWLQRKAGIQ
jgi:mono/diheme cytochrome c family protein